MYWPLVAWLLGLLAVVAAPLQAQSQERLTVEQLLEEDAAQAAVARAGVRAQLVPVNRTQLAAGLSAMISRVNYRVGESVRQGEVLVEFDCAYLQAQRKIYEARKRSGEINLQVKQRLLELNNVGAQELQLSQAELAAAEAELEAINVQLDKCQIRAPFTGTIVARSVQPYEYIAEGEAVMELQSRDELEVLLVAPSSWLDWLETGAEFTFEVEEIGQRFAGRVMRLGGRVDPVSQTILVFGELNETSPRLLPGMSGDISFSRAR